MMHTYHLIWIIPLAFCCGFTLAAVLAAAKDKEE